MVRSLVIDFFSKGLANAVGRAIVNVSPQSKSCTAADEAAICSNSAKVSSPPFLASVSAFDGANGSGTRLTSDQYEPVVQASGGTVLRLSLIGPAAALRVTPFSPNVSLAGNNLAVVSPAPLTATVLVAPLDADGNRIVGAAVGQVSITSGNSAFFKGRPAVAETGTFAIALSPALADATTLLTANVRGAASTVRMTYQPFASDDWSTFAHDPQRTAFQSQPTAIDSANVRRLGVRWKFRNKWSGTFYGSPVVYKGNVIIADTDGNVVDLSAADGSVRWHSALPKDLKQNAAVAFVASTPTIDADDGLVFIGTRRYFEYPAPSDFFALRLSDGSIAWRKRLGNLLRAAPLYANGVVFEGFSGGDGPPIGKCVNGGVTAMNAKTGTIKWTWLVNPFTNPGGGGGVWGAIALDESRLVFGTGNPCGPIVATSQGAAAVNWDGTTAWSFLANDVAGSDNDTGSGVSIVGDDALFFNKDGSLYDVNVNTGKERWAEGFGAPSGLGGFASPSSNGSVILVGAGTIPVTDAAWRQVDPEKACLITQPWRQPGHSAGFASALKAVDRNGRLLWSRKMNAAEVGYIAVAGTIAYANLDESVYALDVASGRVLWSFTGAAKFTASTVIVPSGLYAADRYDVYAFGPSR